jgi:hypothetical protein
LKRSICGDGRPGVMSRLIERIDGVGSRLDLTAELA